MKDKIKDELLDQLLENYSKPEDLTGPEGLLTEGQKRGQTVMFDILR